MTYWKEDPMWAVLFLGGIVKKTFRGVQEPHQVDSSLLIPQQQQRGALWMLRGTITFL